jgi:hypothetical protein
LASPEAIKNAGTYDPQSGPNRGVRRPSGSNDAFNKAASRKTVQDLSDDESEVSEEDPDDDPSDDVLDDDPQDETTASASLWPAIDGGEEVTNYKCTLPSVEAHDNSIGDAISMVQDIGERDPEETISQRNRKASVKKAFRKPNDWRPLDIVNRGKTYKDMVHLYTVVYVETRNSKQSDHIEMKSFSSLDDANGFAEQELHKIRLQAANPEVRVWRREESTDPDDGTYDGSSWLDKDGRDKNRVYVIRRVRFKGDIAEFDVATMKTVVSNQIFEVVHLVTREESIISKDVVFRSSKRAIANKEAHDRLGKACREKLGPNIDKIIAYQEQIIPVMEERLEEADEEDCLFDLPVEIEEETINVYVTGPHDIEGPLN